jgi:hypothetical protein
VGGRETRTRASVGGKAQLEESTAPDHVTRDHVCFVRPCVLRAVCGRPSEIREMSGALVQLGREQVLLLSRPPRTQHTHTHTHTHTRQGVATAVHGFIAAALEPQEALARGEHVYTLNGVPSGKPSVSSS